MSDDTNSGQYKFAGDFPYLSATSDTRELIARTVHGTSTYKFMKELGYINSRSKETEERLIEWIIDRESTETNMSSHNKKLDTVGKSYTGLMVMSMGPMRDYAQTEASLPGRLARLWEEHGRLDEMIEKRKEDLARVAKSYESWAVSWNQDIHEDRYRSGCTITTQQPGILDLAEPTYNDDGSVQPGVAFARIGVLKDLLGLIEQSLKQSSYNR